MTQAEVTGILGQPYAMADTPEGQQRYHYQFLSGGSASGGNESKSFSKEGAIATVLFKAGRVIAFSFEMFGRENFERLIAKKMRQ